ncbi:adoMet-dependent tRNA methyltransferase complex subunit Trm112 [Eremomyces bilateralis CBS 781.70]|uniref:AdoMet-dependent tRNA methyltransferase complex subunit Trm112 n=1 Tax=Eremomyces bilateralis CBS 781.70 TaxID=1392243 RepID=A0A6G1GDQ1_9PEZI|nr:adoMet-dependent tRNA methyltransferase complex subunit Trm112 [Eremomyces bilateralis CBS 781.70]KAF1815989.1 adoMet-dependent tRNA methyltransferase complex subunit Trm112 [Eremomyces bilateralis CBS 781.70]
MKLLTLNFVSCARKACKSSTSSFPLHPRDAELELVEMEFNPQFLQNMLPKLEWEALQIICNELALPTLPSSTPAASDLFESGGEGSSPAQPTQVARDLHKLLLETTIREGLLVCSNCGHEYAIKEGIANFLLPPHLV